MILFGAQTNIDCAGTEVMATGYHLVIEGVTLFKSWISGIKFAIPFLGSYVKEHGKVKPLCHIDLMSYLMVCWSANITFAEVYPTPMIKLPPIGVTPTFVQ